LRKERRKKKNWHRGEDGTNWKKGKRAKAIVAILKEREILPLHTHGRSFKRGIIICLQDSNISENPKEERSLGVRALLVEGKIKKETIIHRSFFNAGEIRKGPILTKKRKMESISVSGALQLFYHLWWGKRKGGSMEMEP